MFKILPIIALVLVTAGFITWKVFFSNKTTSSISLPNSFSIGTTSNEATDSATNANSIEDRIKELEFQVTSLLKNKTTSSGTVSDTQLKALQASIDDLKTRVAKLENSPAPASSTTSTSTKKSPVYIPLASSLTVTNSEWTEAGGSAISIDPGDYSGYTSMQLEGNLKVAAGNDKAFARILNADGTSILSSEISTTSQSSVWLTSSGFNIGSGNKIYKIQIKTLTGFGGTLENSRIKVNF